MTTTRIKIGVTSVQAAKPTYAYGSTLAQVPIKSGAALALLRAVIPTSIPKNAVVTSAKVWINQYDGGWSGANTLTLLRHLAAYTYKVTWNTKPAATTSASQSKTGSAAGTWWSITVTDDVQAFIAGTKKNYGWRLTTSSGTLHKLRTHLAAASQPYLELIYEVPSKVPTNLAPQGGAVSIDKPILTFATGDDTVAINVQIDPAADAGSPEFDSGEVAETAGILDLADTAYAGLADGDTTFWRARAKGSTGWSAWSPWVSFLRADPPTVTLTSPSATPADGTPPFEWTFSGTQTAWQADFLDANGKVLDSSGLVPGDDTAWTPDTGLKATGLTGTARIRAYDDVTRIATTGHPVYAEDSVSITVDFDGTVDPLDTLSAAQIPHVPGVVLTGTYAAGAPDEVAIFRNDVQVARMPGTDVFTGTDFAWTDYTVPMNRQVTYRVAPIIGGAVAAGGPTVDVTPVCTGLWLIDPATGVKAVLWGANQGSYEQGDLATLHVPVAPGARPVRRRLRRGVRTSAQTGDIIDALEFSADDTLEALEEIFPANDAGVVYRLVDGHRNTAVIAGDFLAIPSPLSSRVEVIASGQFWTCEI